MARTPLLQLSDVSYGFGQERLFDGLDLVIHPGDRLALVGRNGAGKSSLMEVLAGLLEPDDGTRSAAPRLRVERLAQEPDFVSCETLGEFVYLGLYEEQIGPAAAMAAELSLDLETLVEKASGGERRKAALIAVLAGGPQLLLLDEPTNHLDIGAIEWLEGHLRSSRMAYVVISHDRAFLSAVCDAVLWLDRGQVRRLDKNPTAFETWRDTVWAEEDLARHKLDRKIKAEARWAVEGISARRKRNMGRVRALQDLRAERAAMIKRQGRADLQLSAGESSGRKVIEADGISKSFGDQLLFRPFSLRLMRGDRLAIVGPNGAGKTTLLNILTGQMAPDTGTVSHGSKLELAVFDQARATLEPDRSLWDSLTHDPEMAVDGRADQVMVRGAPRHVVGYLKDFLFTDDQVRAPVRALSGGEKARLILARIMARDSNLLVLDEPTNDLDIETLDLLQDVLSDYAGTVILISHDRDFIDRLATATLALEGDGTAQIYAGGWSDYRAQRGADQRRDKPVEKVSKTAKSKPVRAAKTGLSFTESHRLEALPAEIERLTAEIGKLEEFLADPELFTRERLKFDKASAALVERQEALAAAEEEWLDLMEKAEAG